MKQRVISFIGFMGCGKSTVARLLAKSLNWQVISLDTEIEKKEQRKIVDIFSQNGEEYFREIESRLLEEILQNTKIVLDCGGGIVVKSKNLDLLKAKSLVIHLGATVDSLYERVKDKTHRPLLNVPNPKEKMRELLKVRQPLYNQAHLIIKTDDKTSDEVCLEILGHLK